jgi:repressor LexA
MTSQEPADRPDPVLTWRRRKILRFIQDFTQRHGYPPSLREIGEAVELVPSTVSYHRSILEKDGYLTRDPGLPRTSVALPQGGRGILPGADAVEVPLVGQVAAGVPVLAEEMIEDNFWLPRRLVGKGTLFMLKVAGDSMTGAAITDGDWVVVRQQPTAENGDIVAAAVIDGIDAEATIKTLHRANGHVWLMPQNPRYPPMPGDNATVLGKVVTVLHRL